MGAAEWGLLLLAGAAAGLVGSVAGLASLISYPALLAVGLGPVQANVTNTVALVWSGVGSALGSRVELTGQRLRLVPLMAAAALGGLTGGGLLLLTPPLQKGRLAVCHDGGSEDAASAAAAAGGGRRVTLHGYRVCNWQDRDSQLRSLDTGLPVSQTYIGTERARKP